MKREYVDTPEMHQRLKIVRKTLNISAREMSRRLGRSISYYSTLETKTEQPITEGAVVAICAVFNVNYDYIVFGEGPVIDEKSAGMKTIMNIYEKLPEAMQTCAVEYVRYLRYRVNQEKNPTKSSK